MRDDLFIHRTRYSKTTLIAAGVVLVVILFNASYVNSILIANISYHRVKFDSYLFGKFVVTTGIASDCHLNSGKFSGKRSYDVTVYPGLPTKGSLVPSGKSYVLITVPIDNSASCY